MKTEYTINILGDVCLTKDNLHIFEKKEPEKLFNSLFNILQKGDLNIANLEAPLKEKENKPILKTGPNLYITENVIDVLNASNFNILSLANNHILDYGSKAVANTIKEINKKGMEYIGAGLEKSDVRRPIIKKLGAINVGIMAFAEHEFNTFDNFNAGANGFDVYESFEDIKNLKESCDYLIIIFHGGIEYHKYPSPLLQKKCRKMVESGADLVLCQHSHCIGSMENYNEGTILYGQGNSIFGYIDGEDDWNEGLIVQIKFNDGVSKLDIIPIATNANGSIDFMNKEQQLKCISDFNKRSSHIHDKIFIKKEWIKFCDSRKSKILPQFYGKSKYFEKLNELLNNKLIDIFYTKRNRFTSHNLIRCESLLESMNTIFKQDYLE